MVIMNAGALQMIQRQNERRRQKLDAINKNPKDYEWSIDGIIKRSPTFVSKRQLAEWLQLNGDFSPNNNEGKPTLITIETRQKGTSDNWFIVNESTSIEFLRANNIEPDLRFIANISQPRFRAKGQKPRKLPRRLSPQRFMGRPPSQRGMDRE